MLVLPVKSKVPKVRTRTRTVAQLESEVATLRRELAKLEVFRNLAYRDPLTGLWNRRYFGERLAQELSRASRSNERAFSVIALDVNDLKRINDRQGHTAGDRTIQWVANFLKSVLRSHDVCCRTGGDEFAVIIPELGGAECEHVIVRLRRELDAANAGLAIPLGLSFGSASYPREGQSSEALIEAADAAMYADKRRQKVRASERIMAPLPSAIRQ